MDPVSQWIGNLGFPVAAYLLMYRLVTNTLDRNTQAITLVDKTLQEVREGLRELSRSRAE